MNKSRRLQIHLSPSFRGRLKKRGVAAADEVEEGTDDERLEVIMVEDGDGGMKVESSGPVAAVTGGRLGHWVVAPKCLLTESFLMQRFTQTLWKDESPPPEPTFTPHEYLFGVGGGSVTGLRCGMKNGGQLSIFHPIFSPRPPPPVTHLINESVFTCLYLWDV